MNEFMDEGAWQQYVEIPLRACEPSKRHDVDETMLSKRTARFRNTRTVKPYTLRFH